MISGPPLGLAPFVLWIVFLIAGSSNAVNLTDRPGRPRHQGGLPGYWPPTC